jgi:hypothetical protein
MNNKKLKLIFSFIVIWIVGELVTKIYYQEIKEFIFNLLKIIFN